ncbi:MAG: phosphonate ABC transporter, permease protein PhnE [Inquilinaceae bacterium]
MTDIVQPGGRDRAQALRPDLRQSLRRTLMWGALAGLLIWGWGPVEMHNATALVTDGGNMAVYLRGFLEPEFHDWPTYLREMVITVQIAVWGTFLAVVAGIPLGILSSANMAPAWVVQPVRRLMDAFRAINEIVFAMLFVVAVGLGPFAGVMALFIHTTGVIAKLFSEAVEAIDPRPVEGIRATGASRIQEITFGVIPQVLPLWISYTLYRFESNVRSATVLGIVGAGGIGQLLWEYIRGFYYAETAAVLIVIIVSVSLLDILSQRLRRLVT